MKHARIPWKKYLLWTLGMCALYCLLRFTNLTKLPIFTDEAIYIRWSQIGSRDANWRFISLVDGKQPLFTWIMMVFFRILHADPLYVGRFVSVCAGFFTMIGIWFLTLELFGKRRVALIAVILYLLCPFTLMYDRLALYDSLVTTFWIWNLYIGIRLAKNPRLDTAMILGLTLGAGMLNKSSGFISLYLLPFTLFLFDFSGKDRNRRILSWIAYAGVAAILSEVYYGVLRLSPLYGMITEKNAVFVYPFSEWIRHPFQFLFGNLRGLFDWTIGYLTVPVFIAAALSIGVFFRNFRQKAILGVYWIAPLFGLALFGRVLYPRYVLFISMPLLLFAASTISWIIDRFGKTIFGIVLVGVIFFPSVMTSYFIVTNPVEANLPFSERLQILDDWPAGGGIPEVNAFIGEKAKSGPIAVYTDGTFGLLPYAIEIYYVDNPNVEIHGIWPVPERIPEEIVKKAGEKPVYVIMNQKQEAPSWPMKLIGSYTKGKRLDRTLRLYEVTIPAIQELPAK